MGFSLQGGETGATIIQSIFAIGLRPIVIDQVFQIKRVGLPD